ncbi:MAG TPA: winged helix-turn-helix transcriptional regulator [Solirubrobacteraceae bacterium]|nr:winged helix-turn-helix transcriptional regulator [Solirubrobacteraceae bacterium]
MRGPREGLDQLDGRILDLLSKDGRASITSIAKALRLSRPVVSRRIKRLEDEDYILKYTIVLGRQSQAAEAYVEVTLTKQASVDDFLAKVMKLSRVREAAQIAGRDVDAMLRVRAQSNDELSDVVNELREWPEVKSTVTMPASHRQRHV